MLAKVSKTIVTVGGVIPAALACCFPARLAHNNKPTDPRVGFAVVEMTAE